MAASDRITDWKPGDRVRVIREYTDLTRPTTPVKAGTVGTLMQFYRTQDGVEIWDMSVPLPPTRSMNLYAVSSDNAERVGDDDRP